MWKLTIGAHCKSLLLSPLHRLQQDFVLVCNVSVIFRIEVKFADSQELKLQEAVIGSFPVFPHSTVMTFHVAFAALYK